MCNVLTNSENNSNPVLGTLCFIYNGSNFFNQAFKESIIPQTDYLQSVYMLMMTNPGETIPNLMFKYTPGNDSSLQFFTNKSLFAAGS